jgi:hypothetical protein
VTIRVTSLPSVIATVADSLAAAASRLTRRLQVTVRHAQFTVTPPTVTMPPGPTAADAAGPPPGCHGTPGDRAGPGCRDHERPGLRQVSVELGNRHGDRHGDRHGRTAAGRAWLSQSPGRGGHGVRVRVPSHGNAAAAAALPRHGRESADGPSD